MVTPNGVTASTMVWTPGACISLVCLMLLGWSRSTWSATRRVLRWPPLLQLAIRTGCEAWYVRRLESMGSVGVPIELTGGLDAVQGYTPSHENMRRIMDNFAWARALVSDEPAEVLCRASVRPAPREFYGAMFPGPCQRSADALGSAECDLRSLPTTRQSFMGEMTRRFLGRRWKPSCAGHRGVSDRFMDAVWMLWPLDANRTDGALHAASK